LGEDLALFRDRQQRLGLVTSVCPHRGASLVYGIPDEDGIRCPYHGWLFSRNGACLDQPTPNHERPAYRVQCGVDAYDVEEMGGLIFAYLGPKPSPALPPYAFFLREETATEFRTIGIATIPCNWLQIMENSFDPVHAEWLHGRYFNYLRELAGQESNIALGGEHSKIAFDRFKYGIIKRRLRVGQSEEHDDWRVGHPVVFPNILIASSGSRYIVQIRVPVDDVTTKHYWYVWWSVPSSDSLPDSVRSLRHTYTVEIYDSAGRIMVDTIDGQDMMAWITQGRIADRTQEHLSLTDQGVRLYRNVLLEQLGEVAKGDDPMCVFRDPSMEAIEFPVESKGTGYDFDPANWVAQYLNTQAKFSPLIQALSQHTASDGRRVASVVR
jgi:5,5'-dehydrodivanillate O-demethylase